MDIVEGSIAAIAAAFSGVAAWGAMRAAKSADRNSQAANQTAELAYQTAKSVEQIERDRWHRELTPQLRFRVIKERSYMELLIRYDGPSALGKINSVELCVRDDRDRTYDPILGGGLPAEERDRTIWGPLRFRHSADGADETGRSVKPFYLLPGDERRFGLDLTHPHRLYGGGSEVWKRVYQDADFRLRITCTVEGHRTWNVTADVPQPHSSSASHLGTLAT